MGSNPVISSKKRQLLMGCLFLELGVRYARLHLNKTPQEAAIIQRELSVGFYRASMAMAWMDAHKYTDSASRKVLISEEEYLKKFGDCPKQ